MKTPLFITALTVLICTKTHAQTDTIINIQISKSNYNNYICQQAKADAQKNVVFEKGEAWKVGVSTAIGTPIIGAVPAIIYASKITTNEQLNYPNSPLSNNDLYRESYLLHAQKMKRNRILKAYIGGTCVSFAVAGVIMAIATINSMDMKMDLR